MKAMKAPLYVKVLGWTAAVLLPIGLLLPITVYERSRFTCLKCRSEKREYHSFGVSWHKIVDTDYSPWFRAHFPPHQHEWTRTGCTVGKSVFGTGTYFGCGTRHPVTKLKPEWQLQFVQTADTNTLAQFFTGMTSTNLDVQKKAVDLALETLFGK